MNGRAKAISAPATYQLRHASAFDARRCRLKRRQGTTWRRNGGRHFDRSSQEICNLHDGTSWSHPEGPNVLKVIRDARPPGCPESAGAAHIRRT